MMKKLFSVMVLLGLVCSATARIHWNCVVDGLKFAPDVAKCVTSSSGWTDCLQGVGGDLPGYLGDCCQSFEGLPGTGWTYELAQYFLKACEFFHLSSPAPSSGGGNSTDPGNTDDPNNGPALEVY